MSKLLKNVTALLLAVAMIVPGLFASGNPLQNFPDLGEEAPTVGSITVVRIAGDEYELTGPNDDVVTPVPPGHFIQGVPIRIRQVILNDDAVPSTSNLTTPGWIEANTSYAPNSEWIYGVTGSNGEVTFPNLPLGIWRVQEIGTHTVDADTITNLPAGTVVNNPVHPDNWFSEFLVGLPRFFQVECSDDADEDEVCWDFEFNVRVYPKSEVPTYEGTYKDLVHVEGNVATWEVAHRIPASVGTITHFSVTDILSENQTFLGANNVIGRFTRVTDVEEYPADSGDYVAIRDWDRVTGVLVRGTDYNDPGTHFIVENVGQRVDIIITPAGRAFLAANGLVGADGGNVMFQLQSSIDEPGRHSNVSRWNVGEEPYCPIDDPECDDPDPICPPTDPDCDEPCPADDPDCDSVIVEAFNLEVRKVNDADQSLDDAEFALYRELTDEEVEELDLANLPSNVVNAGTTADPIWVIPLLDADGDHIVGTTVNGITNFGGIPTNSYDFNIWLREVSPPEGYAIIDEWMAIDINEAHERPGYPRTFIVDVVVLNVPEGGWQLPDTGGMGTIILTVVGLGLVGGSLVLFLGGKKEEEDAA